MPFWRPEPLTSVIDRLGMPAVEQLLADRLECFVADECFDFLHVLNLPLGRRTDGLPPSWLPVTDA